MPSIKLLWFLLASLILFSCFFSVAETAYMAVNRYRLRHLARLGHTRAKLANRLLERPDRLLGVILLGDTFADIFASSVATIIAIHYFGNFGIAVTTTLLTLIVLIFGEVAPKTLAALKPMPIVLYAAFPLWLLLKITYPVVWLVNILSNGLLYLAGVRHPHPVVEHFTMDELRTVVTESGQYMSGGHQAMLLQLLDLEKISVEDIMISRADIVGIDLNRPWPDILLQLTTSQHTRLPVYQEQMDNVIGVLHTRVALNLMAEEKLTKETLEACTEKPYFIPEGTRLTKQLLQFCQKKMRAGLVVNEYGDIQGLVTMEDILEEIVGEFTTDTASLVHKDILPQQDGSYLVDGSVNLRILNRTLHTQFPLTGPKTLNGLIIEYLEMIPPSNICIRLAGYPIEILQVKDNMVRTLRLLPVV